MCMCVHVFAVDLLINLQSSIYNHHQMKRPAPTKIALALNNTILSNVIISPSNNVLALGNALPHHAQWR